MKLRHAAIASVAALALAGTALAVGQQQPAAQPAPTAHPAPAKPGAKALDKPLWKDLKPAQQVALQPLATEWDQMDGVRKQKWLEMANRFASMKPEEQARVHERMREWVRLTPAQRKLARDTYSRTKKLDPGQKTATWESYQQLPDEQKKKLAEAAAARKQGATPPAHQPNARPGIALHKGATACPAGTVKNPVSATPPCVPAPAATAPAGAQPPVPAAVTPAPTTAPAPAPASPVPNAQ